MTRALLFLFTTSLVACGTPDAAPSKIAASTGMVETPMAEVEAKLASGDCVVFDANGAETREKHGVVKGAKLLSSYNAYAASELPTSKDTDLVFYCGSTHCTASDQAAERAITEGYTHVSVMREGIAGWTKAGKPTVPYKAETKSNDG